MGTKTLERASFVRGQFTELRHHFEHYQALAAELLELEGRAELCERTLMSSRDHLIESMAQSQMSGEDVPDEWQEVLAQIRFVGARLGDACMTILRERGTLTTDELMKALNDGEYRFRTPTPRKEIHAAMMRQPNVNRVDDTWVYEAPAEDDLIKPRRMRRKENAA